MPNIKNTFNSFLWDAIFKDKLSFSKFISLEKCQVLLKKLFQKLFSVGNPLLNTFVSLVP